MSSYLKPRRGSKNSAQNITLQSGEVFFECIGGPGNGKGRIKMGNGANKCPSLKYFLDIDSTPVSFTDVTASNNKTLTELAEEIKPDSYTAGILPNIVTVLKQSLYNAQKLFDIIGDYFDTYDEQIANLQNYSAQNRRHLKSACKKYLLYHSNAGYDGQISVNLPKKYRTDSKLYYTLIINFEPGCNYIPINTYQSEIDASLSYVAVAPYGNPTASMVTENIRISITIDSNDNSVLTIFRNDTVVVDFHDDGGGEGNSYYINTQSGGLPIYDVWLEGVDYDNHWNDF